MACVNAHHHFIPYCLTPRVPKGPVICTTTRVGGCSLPPYATANVALHVGDDEGLVEANRARLEGRLTGCSDIQWLQQVHGIEVVSVADTVLSEVPRADAVCVSQPGIAGAVLTADCLAVVFWSEPSQEVAVAHAGWRGLAGGVLEAAVAAFREPSHRISAWLGPAIALQQFEVGEDVREAFVARYPESIGSFLPGHRLGHYYADLLGLAQTVLKPLGLNAVHRGFQSMAWPSQTYYSYRQTSVTGRIATLAYWPS